MYVLLVYTVLNGWMKGLMMNAFRKTKKKIRQWKNKITVLFQNPQINEWAERQGRKAKGRALQSRLFLITFFWVLQCSRPDSVKPHSTWGGRAAR